jgi:hypothetical protein
VKCQRNQAICTASRLTAAGDDSPEAADCELVTIEEPDAPDVGGNSAILTRLAFATETPLDFSIVTTSSIGSVGLRSTAVDTSSTTASGTPNRSIATIRAATSNDGAGRVMPCEHHALPRVTGEKLE